MEENPFLEANSPTSSQISHIVWTPKVHYRCHNSPQFLYILIRTNTATFVLYFTNIHFNIVIPSTPLSLKWSPSIRFPIRSSPHMSHSPSVSFLLIWSPEEQFFAGECNKCRVCAVPIHLIIVYVKHSYLKSTTERVS